MYFFNKFTAVFLTIVLVIFVNTWVFRTVNNYARSTALILEIFPLTPFKPLSKVTKEPKKVEVNIPSRNIQLSTDIWIPGDYSEGKKYPVLILSPGVNLPKDDERISSIIQGMARSGFVVSASSMPELIDSRYLNYSVEDFVNVYSFLENLPYVDKDKMGFAGFCLGSSLALLASSDARINEKVAFVSVNDVLYDMYTFTRDAVTEKINDAEPEIPWTPMDEVRKILFTEYTDYIKNKTDAKIVYDSLFNRQELGQKQKSQLSKEAIIFYDFLSNKDPDKSLELFEKIPDEAKGIIARMSPKSNIGNVKAKIFITSGRNVFLPAKQATDLAGDLPKDQVEYTSLNFFQHDKIVKSLSDWENIQQAVLGLKHLKGLFDFLEQN